MDLSGGFNVPVRLEEGTQFIAIEATNAAGRVTLAHRAVIHGRFEPDTLPLRDALLVRLNNTGLAAIEPALEQELSAAKVAPEILRLNPVYRDSLLSLGAVLVSAEVHVTSLSYMAQDVVLRSTAGGVAVRGSADNVVLNLRAGSYSGLPWSATGTATASRASLNATLSAVADPSGRFVVRGTGTQVELQNFRLDVPSFPTFLIQAAQDSIRRKIEGELRDLVQTKAVAAVEAFLNRAATGRSASAFGQRLAFQARPSEILFDADGLTFRVDGTMAFPRAAGVPAAPGSLVTAGPAPTLATPFHFGMAVNDDLINRALYAAWQGGLLRVTVDQAWLARVMTVPVPFRIDASLVQRFLPALAPYLSPNDPLIIGVRTDLPPVVRMRGSPYLADLQAGEVVLDFYVDRAGTRILILSVALHAKFGLSAQLAGNRIFVSLDSSPTILANVLAEPLVDVDDRQVESLIHVLLTPLLPLIGNSASGITLDLFQPLGIRSGQFFQTGPSGDFLGIVGDLY
ncbi:MAG: hypothetical protein HY722_14750 [Planctomycetes bacterium]|nr:hypothetical protein [Planctomycetota bacterium]